MQKKCKERNCSLIYYANGYCREHNHSYWLRPSNKIKFKKKCFAKSCNKTVCKNDYCRSHQEKVDMGLDPNIDYRKGINNHRWNGGKSDYPKHRQMQKLRKTKLEQVGNNCEECGIKKPSNKLNLHHIDGSKDNHVIENVLLLCQKCHLSIYHSGPKHPCKCKMQTT